jgi:hypothetical protein
LSANPYPLSRTIRPRRAASTVPENPCWAYLLRSESRRTPATPLTCSRSSESLEGDAVGLPLAVFIRPHPRESTMRAAAVTAHTLRMSCDTTCMH